MKANILIIVEGGCITSVQSDSPDIGVEIVDLDNTEDEHEVERQDTILATCKEVYPHMIA